MRKLLFVFSVIWLLAIPAAGLEITAPEVPDSGREMMPYNTDSFGDGLMEMARNAEGLLRSQWKSSVGSCYRILVLALFSTMVPILSERSRFAATLAGAISITGLMLSSANGMIRCASDAIREILEYGKLLCPVMTTALAAQGGITASSLLYAGTTAFIALLGTLVSRLMIPMVYLFLLFSVTYSSFGEEFLKKLADGVKGTLGWILKTLLMIFTTYMSITGVVSGTTDTAAVKAAKTTISTLVPVIGGILSDASESVLVSMGLVKNAAGIYGILAVSAVFLGPFVKLGLQYLLLKATGAVCSLFADKRISHLVEQFSTAMGLLLAMVASSGVLVLISTVCFMKGMN